MPIINDAVRSSSSSRGFGLFSSDHLNSYDASLIKSISRNERRRWRGRSYSADLKNYRKNGDKRKGRDQIIPRQVLTIFWEWGIKFTAKPPSTGMGLHLPLASMSPSFILIHAINSVFPFFPIHLTM